MLHGRPSLVLLMSLVVGVVAAVAAVGVGCRFLLLGVCCLLMLVVGCCCSLSLPLLRSFVFLLSASVSWRLCVRCLTSSNKLNQKGEKHNNAIGNNRNIQT